MPKRILWRTFFILITPIIILQAVIGVVFYRQYINDEINASVERTLSHIRFIKDQQNNDISSKKEFLSHFSDHHPGYFKLIKKDKRAQKRCSVSGIMLLVDRRLKALETSFDICRIKKKKLYRIYIPFDEEYFLRITHHEKYFFSSQWHFLPVWSLGTSLLLIYVAFLFLRNQLHPIMRLGKAAKAFGEGNSNVTLRPAGAIEVRQASAAFIEMRQKISEHLHNRSLLLAGISHDLRTILTRLSLELSLMSDTQEKSAMREDVDRMKSILKSYLDFVSDNSVNMLKKILPEELIKSLISRFQDDKHNINFQYKGPLNITLKDQTLERIIINLLSNATKYGTEILIIASYSEKIFSLSIEDNGLGVGEKHLDDIFRPFFVVDKGRNYHKNSGSGLGLALVKDIVHSNGGTIYAKRSEILGGLKISLSLPCPSS